MKKWIALVLALIMSLSLCACVKNEDPNTTDKSTVSTSPSTGSSNTKTVTCLTSYTSKKGDTELKYDITYEVDGVHVKPNPCVSGYENVYGWDGKLLYELRYDENGANTYRLDHTYDALGNKTELLQTDLRDNSTASRNSYVYDANGRLLSESYEGRNGYIMYTIVYSYDDRGFLKEAVDLDYNDDGTTTESEKSIYTCDDNGKILTCEEYIIDNGWDKPGQWCTFVCSYDDQGRLISNVWNKVGNGSRVNDSQYYTYDAQGRLSSFKRVKFNGDTDSELVYTYDETGRLAKTSDSITGWENTLHYTEITLNTELASQAEAWALDGALKAFVKIPEFEK